MRNLIVVCTLLNEPNTAGDVLHVACRVHRVVTNMMKELRVDYLFTLDTKYPLLHINT